MGYPLRAVVLLALLSVPLLATSPAAADDALQAELRLQLLWQGPPDTPASSASAHSAELLHVYRMRNFQPLWQSPSRRAALARAMDRIGDDGLDRGRYWQAYFPDPPTDSIIQQAQAELAATEACLRALADLQRGQVEMLRTGRYWRADSFPPPVQALPADALAGLADDDIDAVFDRFRPPTALYSGLRQALGKAVIDAAVGGEWPVVSEGPSLKPGMDDVRVLELRARLVAGGHLAAEHASGTQVDDVVSAAVAAFQRDHGLEPDGVTGRATLAALNVSRADRIAQLRINLERARWIAFAQHGDHVLVDIAGYRLSYMRGDDTLWSARTQVGMHDRETPELLSRITHFTVNPTWTVPPTILRKDIIPKASTDPDYLASRNIRVLDRNGTELDPAFVDWQHTGGLTFRQDFGDGSALGKVAIRFPNPDRKSVV